MLRMKSLAFILCLGLFGSVLSKKKLNTIYEWKYIDYVWESSAVKADAIKSGHYNHTSPIVIDVDSSKDGRVFVTVIRTKGVPASLTTVSDETGPGGPLLKPYPDWSWSKKTDCSGITNVYRVAIDECNRLWVLDNGQIDDEQKCEAQILVFNLDDDNLMKRIKIDNKLSHNFETKAGLLVTPIVETEGLHCEKTTVYIADVTGHALLIYNGTGSPWRLESSVYTPQRSAEHVEIVGETFKLDDGVIGMALSPPKNDERSLFFRPFASYEMVAATTSDLRQSYNKPVHYDVFANILPSPAVAMAFSLTGVLFFGLTTETALTCFDMDKPMIRENIEIIDQDPERYQFASGLKIIRRGTGKKSEELWMATNRYQKIALGNQNFNEINFRIMSGLVFDLVADTKCDTRSIFRKCWDNLF